MDFTWFTKLAQRLTVWGVVIMGTACASSGFHSNLDRGGTESPENLLRECRGRMATARGILAKATTLEHYNSISIELDAVSALSSLLAAVHPSKELRDAAQTCEQEASQFATDLSLNRELYQAMQALDVSHADAPTKRLHGKILQDFRRSGVDRDDDTRAKIRRLNDELMQIGQDFDKNTTDDVRSIALDSVAELAGLPQDYIDAHKPGTDGKIRITTRYPDLIPFMTYAKSRKARERLAFENKNRSYPINETVFHRLLEKRHELATLLKYATWSHMVMEDKMIKTPTAAWKFIKDISAIATPGATREYADLLAVKQQDDPSATVLADWERGYYEEQLKKQRYSVDSQVVRSYFDFVRVKQGLLDLTSELYGLRYLKVTDAKVWHQSVDVYDMFDAATGARLGRIYLDLHPRDGKYGHAAQFTLRSGVEGVQLPEGVLVCNFPDPSTSSGPALMEHGDVVTFFHEFGHLMHHVLGGRQHWIRFSGVATEWDFVEAPSQFFESWAYEHAVLSRFATHHKTGEVIPADLVVKLKHADEFGKGLQARHQMFYASLALTLHDQDPTHLDVTKTMKNLQKQYSNFPFQEGTHFFASFGHLNGYSSNYYTYMWSEVISKDLLSEFKKKGMMNKDLAQRYRKTILEAGGVKDASELVQDFLGRPYSFNAFREWLEGENL